MRGSCAPPAWLSVDVPFVDAVGGAALGAVDPIVTVATATAQARIQCRLAAIR